MWKILVMAELITGTLCTILVKTQGPELIRKPQAKHLFRC